LAAGNIPVFEQLLQLAADLEGIEIKKWTDPATGKEYCLKHLRNTVNTYQVMLDKGKPLIDVPVQVYYSNHCYSRGREPGDPDDWVLPGARKLRDGRLDERVFCPDRWDFSLALPAIICNLADKGCYQGDHQEILYRLEGANPRDREQGWYICIRLSFRENNTPNVALNVRSVHWRPNKPFDIGRGHGTQRFYALLAKLLKRHGP